MQGQLADLLGAEASSLLTHRCTTIPKESLHLPGPDSVERHYGPSDRNPRVLGNLQRIFAHGRLANTGYVSILPVDQGIEHSAGASFAPNPEYFDPENIIRLAIHGGCNAVASTFGVLGAFSRRYAHRIPFIVKINHNELLTYPNQFDQVMFGSVHRAYDMGAVAVGATIYFGSDESRRQIVEVAEAFSLAHELGMATILWCYLRNSAFKADQDYHVASDLTGQANHLGVTIQADIIKQKMPENNGGYTALKFGKTSPRVYTELTTDHPIDLCRYQVANCYMGLCGLINSGGASGGESDLAEAVRTAVINKRAGGMGLISGRKAFQRPQREGVELLQTIQDVYLSEEITVAQGEVWKGRHMSSTVELPKAFSVRNDQEFFPIQHLMARLNPQLMVIQVATGRHVEGGCTVFWGIVYDARQVPDAEAVHAALGEAGFDRSHGEIQRLSL